MTDQVVVFRVAPVIRLGLLFGLVVIIALAIRDLSSSPMWLKVSAVIMVILGCMAWPATFILTDAVLLQSVGAG